MLCSRGVAAGLLVASGRQGADTSSLSRTELPGAATGVCSGSSCSSTELRCSRPCFSTCKHF